MACKICWVGSATQSQTAGFSSWLTVRSYSRETTWVVKTREERRNLKRQGNDRCTENRSGREKRGWCFGSKRRVFREIKGEAGKTERRCGGGKWKQWKRREGVKEKKEKAGGEHGNLPKQAIWHHAPAVRQASWPLFPAWDDPPAVPRGGRGRETCRESAVWERERGRGGNKALFICRIFFKAGRSAEKKRCSDRETRGTSRPKVQRAWLCRPPVRLRQSASVHSGSSSIYKRYKRISNLGGPLKNHPHRAARGGLSVGVTRVEFGQLAQEQFGPDLVLQLVDEGSSMWS